MDPQAHEHALKQLEYSVCFKMWFIAKNALHFVAVAAKLEGILQTTPNSFHITVIYHILGDKFWSSERWMMKNNKLLQIIVWNNSSLFLTITG